MKNEQFPVEKTEDEWRKALTPQQYAWHLELRTHGWVGTSCRSLDEVIAALKEWGYA